MRYFEYEVLISKQEKKRIEAILKNKKNVNKPLKIIISGDNSIAENEKVKLLLTKTQISRIKKNKNDNFVVKMNKPQVLANVKVDGGFLSVLAGLAAKALPTLLTGLATGVLSGVVENALSKKGDGVYVQRGKHCYQAYPVQGHGLFLSKAPRRISKHPDGIYIKDGPKVYEGKGLLFGKNSPFNSIPILGWFL